jgi:hypothetical protein
MTMTHAMRQHVLKLARALRRASEEHGRPNTFSPGELATLYGGPPSMLAGRIGRSFDLMLEVYAELGGGVWGEAPRYTRGRFAVYS